MERLSGFSGFLFTKYKYHLLATVLLVFTLLYYALKISASDIQWLEAITGVGTFLMAIFIWLHQIWKEWEDNLQKRLTVVFRYENRDIMRCEQALLLHESDLRTFALQLGAQMGYTKFLKFKPVIYAEPPVVLRDVSQKRYFKHYHLRFYLTELPDLKDLDEQNATLMRQRFMAKECFVWRPTFSSGNEVVFDPKWENSSERMNTN